MKRLTTYFAALLLILVGMGCGNSFNDDVTTQNNGGGNVTPTTGSLVFRFARAQTLVPLGTVTLDFDFLNSSNQILLEETRPFAAQHQFDNVPVETVRVEVTSLDQNGFVLARAESDVIVTPGQTQEVSLDVETVTFDSLSASPNPIVLMTGDSTQLSIQGEFSDNTSVALEASAVNLVSANTGIATVTPAGLITGVSAGQTTVTANFTIPGTSTVVTSGPIPVNVNDPTLDEVVVSPNPVNVKAGGSTQLTVSAIFSDQNQFTVDPGQVVFNETSNLIDIDSNGLLTTSAEGTATFTATFNSVTSNPVTVNISQPSLDAVNVTPDPISLTTAGTQQLTLTGDFSDSMQRALPADEATYNVVNPGIATVDANGLLTPVAVGSTTVTVSFTDPVSNSPVSSDPVDITVMPSVTVDDLTITPDPVSVKVGNDVQLSIVANLSNMTNPSVDPSSVTYTGINTSTATLSSGGLITGVAEGTTSFTVTYTLPGGSGPFTSDPVTVNVTPATLDAITVTPDPICLGTGGSVQIMSQGEFSNGGSQSLAAGDGTYSGHNTGVVNISATGLVTPVAIGTTTVTVSYDDPNTMATVMSDPITIEVVGPAVTLTGANTFDTDTGELNGTVASGWDGSILKVESFDLQAGATLDVSGSAPFQVETCGDVNISGIVDAAGGDGGDGNTGNLQSTRGTAGAAGPGGFAGGLGGGIDSTTANRSGEDGAGPGGGGGGITLGVVFVPPSGFAGENENGGGGGGHASAGSPGSVGGATGNPGAGGATYASIPSTLIGGSGGGGGSSFVDAAGRSYSGGGGGGGGGVVSIVAQGTITVNGSIDCSGGDGGDKGPSTAGAGAGGGAGGSIMLVAFVTPTVNGSLMVSGGNGGSGVAIGGIGGVGRTLTSTLNP